MRAKKWLLALGLGLALTAPASAQQALTSPVAASRALTFGNPITIIQNRVVNTRRALSLPANSNIPIAAPYVTSPQHTKLSLSSFLPTGVGQITARPTHGFSIFPTRAQMPNLEMLQKPFQIRTGP